MPYSKEEAKKGKVVEVENLDEGDNDDILEGEGQLKPKE